MTDRRDADRLPLVGHLVEDPVCPDPKRAEAAEPAAQGVSRQGLALKQAEGIIDRVDQRPP